MNNEQMQDIVENLDKYLIGLDDTFAFKCRGCGKCCKNREDILLTSRDIYNIAKKLKLSIPQVIETYCDSYIGSSSRFPLVRLKPRGINKTCPLLNGGRCIVHEVKPSVCALYPLGRLISTDDPLEGIKPGEPLVIRYIINPINCSISRKQTVRSWLQRFGIPTDDLFFIKWHEGVISLSDSIRRFEENGATEKSLELIWDGIYSAMYGSYDVEKEFMPQFLDNSAKILSVISILESKFPEMTGKKDEE